MKVRNICPSILIFVLSLGISQLAFAWKSRLPEITDGMHIEGDKTISKRKSQVCLFFTKSKTKVLGFPIPVGHAMVAFEYIDDDGDRSFNIVHLTEQGIKTDRFLTKDAFKKLFNKFKGHNAFMWGISKKDGLKAFRKARSSNDEIIFATEGKGENNVHNCTSYALKLLEECGINNISSHDSLRGKIPWESRVVEALRDH